MTSLSVLIVDDERPARDKIRRHVSSDDRFFIVGEAENGLEALQGIDRLQPDVVFLDVTMPLIDGFDVLRAVGPERRFDVILSTASDRHAILAFEQNAVDYLLKPYDEERMKRALDRVHERRTLGTSPSSLQNLLDRAPLPRAQRLVIRTDEGWVAIDPETISRVSAADKYVTLRTSGKLHVVRSSLKAMQSQLDPALFVRVHRSEIVNMTAVQAVEPFGHGDALLMLSDGESVVLSRTFRQKFMEAFKTKSRIRAEA